MDIASPDSEVVVDRLVDTEHTNDDRKGIASRDDAARRRWNFLSTPRFAFFPFRLRQTRISRKQRFT